MTDEQATYDRALCALVDACSALLESSSKILKTLDLIIIKLNDVRDEMRYN